MAFSSAFAERFVIPWEVKTASANLENNKGFHSNGPGILQYLLPSTCAVGDVVALSNIHATGQWQITQGAAQTILFANGVASTIGAGGSVTSTSQGSAIYLVCSVDNTNWITLSYSGILTVV